MATLTDVSCMLFNFMKLVGISAKAMDLCNTFEPGIVSSCLKVCLVWQL